MTAVLDGAARAFLARHRVARLATADADGTPHVIPLCYALVGQRLYFVIDAKPKHPGGLALKRMRNIAENPAVALLVDDYAENWTTLAYLLVRGRADVVTDSREQARALRALRTRYPQYRSMILTGPGHPVVRIAPSHAHLWQAAPVERVRRSSAGARPARRAGSPDRPRSRQPRVRRRPR